MAGALADNQWIVEGVMTTVGADAKDDALGALCAAANIAPMGPIVEADFARFILRPFRTSTTYRNLKATGVGVFHVTDDALLLARAAVGKVHAVESADQASVGQISGRHVEPVRLAQHVRGLVLARACRYYEVQVESMEDREDREERTRIVVRTVASQTLRDFFGFNRARHAVLEAAILATRLHLTGKDVVQAEMDRLQVWVDKTGSATEHQALRELRGYVEAWTPTGK